MALLKPFNHMTHEVNDFMEIINNVLFLELGCRSRETFFVDPLCAFIQSHRKQHVEVDKPRFFIPQSIRKTRLKVFAPFIMLKMNTTNDDDDEEEEEHVSLGVKKPNNNQTPFE
jgi:hypothetical protein